MVNENRVWDVSVDSLWSMRDRKKRMLSKALQFKQKIMNSTKKKSELANILDDLRCDDPKKRQAAVRDIKEVASAIGPARVKSQLISFLAQFIDDEEPIVLELLTQLESFTTFLGGAQHEKALLPLLLSFCKTDQKKVALKSCQIIQRIVQGSKDLTLDSIKKLMKTQMNVSKECGVQLIANLFPLLEGHESNLMEMYTPLFSSDNPQVRIIGAKYLQPIAKNLKSKDEIGKLLELVYSDGGELQKIFALQALSDYYEVNNNFTLTKFKHLSIINSWRINIKICDIASLISDKMTKAHFKLIFEPIYLKFMISNEPELRAASCKTLASVAKNMSEDELKSKLQPILKKLAGDTTEFVKVQLSHNIVPLSTIVSSEFMLECVLPIVMFFIKDANSEIALGIIKNFDYLSSKLTKDILEDKIITPLLQQLSTQNWRIKCEIIDILKIFLTSQKFLSENILKVFLGMTDDRIDAVRVKANELIIQIVAKNPKEWSDQYIIPKVLSSKENMTYVKKQNLLNIIEKTAPYVSDKSLKDYQTTVSSYLNDKVANVRMKSIQVVRASSKLNTSAIQKQMDKLKEDKDSEVRDLAKKLRA